MDAFLISCGVTGLVGACIGYGLRSITAFNDARFFRDIIKTSYRYIKADNLNEYSRAAVTDKQMEMAEQAIKEELSGDPIQEVNDGLKTLNLNVKEKFGPEFEVI